MMLRFQHPTTARGVGSVFTCPGNRRRSMAVDRRRLRTVGHQRTQPNSHAGARPPNSQPCSTTSTAVRSPGSQGRGQPVLLNPAQATTVACTSAPDGVCESHPAPGPVPSNGDAPRRGTPWSTACASQAHATHGRQGTQFQIRKIVTTWSPLRNRTVDRLLTHVIQASLAAAGQGRDQRECEPRRALTSSH